MSVRIKRNLRALQALFDSNARQRKKILKTASPGLLNTLCEIALNVLCGNIPLTKSQLARLKKQKSGIKLLASKRVSLKRKKKAINQTGGGFILPLLSIAIPFLTSLFHRG